MMDYEEICSVLGWDQRVLQVLLSTARNNGITVGDLANTVGYDRGFVYRTIETLKKMGFVKTSEGNPTHVSMVDSEEIMQGLELRINEEAIQKADAYLALVNDLENKKTKTRVEQSEFTVISGTENIWALMSKKMKLSTNNIILFVDGVEFQKMRHSTIYDVLENTDCPTMIITDEGEYDIKKRKSLTFMMKNNLIFGRILLIDQDYVLFSGSGMKNYRDPDDVCIVTNDVGIVNHYKQLLTIMHEGIHKEVLENK